MRKQKQSKKDQRGRGRRRKGREREGVKRWGENYPFSLPMLWKRTDELKTRGKTLPFYTNFEGGMGVSKCQGHSQWAWPPPPPPPCWGLPEDAGGAPDLGTLPWVRPKSLVPPHFCWGLPRDAWRRA